MVSTVANIKVLCESDKEMREYLQLISLTYKQSFAT